MTKLSLKRWSGKTLRKTKCATFEKFLTYTTDEKKALGAKSALNCDCRGGVLSTGLGIKFYSDALGHNIPLLGVIPLQLMRTKYWDGTTNRYEDLLFYVDGVRGTLGRYVDVNGRIDRVAMRGIAYDTKGFTVVRKNKHTGVVVVGASGVFLCDIENTLNKVADTPFLPVACTCRHRLFLAQRSRVIVYSSTRLYSDINAEEGGGMIFLPWDVGEVVALKELNDKLYVFFEHGIGEVDVGGEPKDFVMRQISYGGGAISPNSVGRCGQAIFFMANDGLYRFDGNKAEKVLEEMNIMPNDNIVSVTAAAHCEGKIVMRFSDVEGNMRQLAVYEDGKSGYYMSPFIGMTESDNMALGGSDDYVKFLAGDGDLCVGARYEFESQQTDFGVVGSKILRKLRFKGKGNFKISIKGRSRTVERTLRFEDGAVEMELFLHGEFFSFQFILQKFARIESMEAEFMV